jgi:GAF domain-containing protein
MDRVIEDVSTRRKTARSVGRHPVPPEYLAGVSPPSALADSGNRDPLYAAATDLLNSADESAVLGAAVRHAAELLTTHISFVMLLDPGAKFLKLAASVGHRTPTFTTIVRPVQATTAVGTGRPVQSSDFLNDSRLDHDPATDDIIRKEGMRTVLAVPLHHRDRMLGALYVGHREPRHFPAEEVDSLLALSDHVSAALARVQQYAELSLRFEQATKVGRQIEAERAALARAQEIAHDVIARIREQEGVTAVTVALAECLERQLVVTDWKLAPVAQAAGRSYAGISRPSTSFLNRPESREAVAACTESHGPVTAGKDWRVAPIESGRNLLGYLWVGPGAASDDSSVLNLVIDRMIPVVALELHSKGDFERRQRGDFIYELLAERLPDFSVLEARAASFWSRFGEPHRPLILSVGGTDEQWGSRLEAARRLVAAARPNDFAAIYGRHLVLLITPTARHHVEAALSDIRQILDRNHLTVTAVVGGECRDLRGSREAIVAALRLNDLLGTSGVLWAEGLEALTHLFDPAQRGRLEALCRTALAPLRGREGLMDALHAYYDAGGNRAHAARRLKVHVNTLRQRLERAEQILGGSIDDSIRAVPLRLALLVRQVLGEP